MKDFWKSYWKILLTAGALLLLPLIVNAFYLITAWHRIFEEPSTWAMFWATYLSAVASFAMVLITRRSIRLNQIQNEANRVHDRLQNHTNRKINQAENEANRKLQLNILRQQQENLWLDKFREAALNYIKIFNPNNFIKLSHSIRIHQSNISDLTKEIFDRRAAYSTELAFLYRQSPDTEVLKNEIEVLSKQYDSALFDIQEVIINMDTNPELLSKEHIDKLHKNTSVSNDMKKIIKEVFDIYYACDLNRQRYREMLKEKYAEMIVKRAELIKSLPDQVSEVLQTYIHKEQERIDKITGA